MSDQKEIRKRQLSVYKHKCVPNGKVEHGVCFACKTPEDYYPKVNYVMCVQGKYVYLCMSCCNECDKQAEKG